MKIAFVTPWYGPDIPGGMEFAARETAVRLRQAGYQVEILTTCIRDFFAGWSKNHHQPGVEWVNGLAVRRFPVGPRDKHAFDAVNWQLMQGRMVSPAEERLFINEMFHCPELYQYIEQHSHEYVFIFIPYMFATTYFGAQICPKRSIIVPCLHDESYAYMNIYQQMMSQAHTLVMLAPSERRLVDQLFSPPNGQARPVVGVGVDPFASDADRFRQKYGLPGPFVLYVGRRDAGKNVPLLLNYWGRYARERRPEARLALVGPGRISVPPEFAPYVVDLGFIPRQDKFDAYAAAALLCQPSVHESFSLVIMESWLAETPVLVHGACAVTTEHCRLSNGGLYFVNEAEFAATLDYLFEHPATARQIGRNGRNYVLAHYQWPAIIARYGQIIAAVQGDLAR